MSKQSVIYLISWTNNPYFYVGQAQNFNRRKAQHLYEIKNQKHSNSKLQNVYNKYGEPQFQILEYCEVEELNTIEQWYLNEFIGKENCLNIASFAEASARGLKRSEEARKKMSEARKGKNSLNFGKKRSEEMRQKISKALRGKKHSHEHIQKRIVAVSVSILQYSKDGKFIKEWISGKEAAETLNIQASCISNCCKGKQKSAGGFIWKYKDH